MKVKNITSKSITLWFASIFTLSSVIFKLNIGLFFLSPAVLIVIFLIMFPKITNIFFSNIYNDKNFKYVILSTILFIALMSIQALFSDWPTRAFHELIKTFFFFIVTHAIFSIIVFSKNLIKDIRISLLTTSIVISYLFYIYFFEFGETYLGSSISEASQAGRNTLALFIFINLIISVFLISHTYYLNKKQYLDILILIFFILASLLTGSRLGILFSLCYLLILFFNFFLRKKIKKTFLFFIFILFCLSVILGKLFFSELKYLYENNYFISISRIVGFEETNSISDRLILLQIGTNCYLENNIIIGNGLKNYLSCITNYPYTFTLNLHNDHLSILNNVGILGYSIWIFIIVSYSKLTHFSKDNYFIRFGLIIFLFGLFAIDAYNSPIFSILLAFSRWERYNYH